MGITDGDEWVTPDERKRREVERTPVSGRLGESRINDTLQDVDGYAKDADGYVYVLKFIRTEDDETFYYVGMTTNLKSRVLTHTSEFRARKPLATDEGVRYSSAEGSYEFQEIERVVSFRNRGRMRDVLKNKEREMAFEIALEYETTNVLGGK